MMLRARPDMVACERPQGYAHAGYTPKQLEKLQKKGETISDKVSANVVALMVDQTAQVPTLWEAWPPALEPEVWEEFRYYTAEYEPPDELKVWRSKKEVVIEFKRALDAGEIDVKTYVGEGKGKTGGKMHPGFGPARAMLADVEARYPEYLNPLLASSPEKGFPGMSQSPVYIEIDDDESSGSPDDESDEELPRDGAQPACDYPFCDRHDIPVRPCSTLRCPRLHHHLCAIEAGDDGGEGKEKKPRPKKRGK